MANTGWHIAAMNKNTVINLLARECGRADGIRPWAGRHGIDHAFVWRVLNGKKDPSDRVLDALGLERIVTYRKRKQANGRAK